MILPGKHLKQDRTLLGIGAVILKNLEDGQTVSELWEVVKKSHVAASVPLSFDWFALSLSFLYAIDVVEESQGILRMRDAV